jgi:hypothetical protein
LSLPCVTHDTRERTARELDDRGPEACLAETLEDLRDNNPEILDMASKCAASFGERSASIMLELCVFYRLLSAEFAGMDPALRLLAPIPRVNARTRDHIVEQIDDMGVNAFTMSAVEHLERHNPELLQMANASATREGTYLPLMQGFALLYKALLEQAVADTVASSVH